MQPLVFTAIVDRLIDLALEEDIGSGDITTDHLVPPQAQARAVIVAKEELIVAGLDVARRVFERLDPRIVFQPHFCDGDSIPNGAVVVSLQGRLAGLLTAERTALNFLQHLSGIATHVRAYVRQLGHAKLRLVDTRKTTPGWRVLEKYAVRTGGAANHRMGLYDGVLIKDNHIAACGGITAAVERIRTRISHLSKIEVETATLDEVREALAARADIIMLDNMDPATIGQAVSLINGRALVEVSGGVTARDLTVLAATGVDLISCGALTHSARSVDLSMRIEKQ
ncbi:MAG: carboxylating nicotinate-nucleotide diphosphorylase [Desulfobacteraceae bacterium]|nr:MAG: carboxylating nicotinate-nucleotide diphosphorylase [Desulfobacteraceae bacterium]